MCFLRTFNSYLLLLVGAVMQTWGCLPFGNICSLLPKGEVMVGSRGCPQAGKTPGGFIGFGVRLQHVIGFSESPTVVGSSNGLRTWGPGFQVSCPSG